MALIYIYIFGKTMQITANTLYSNHVQRDYCQFLLRDYKFVKILVVELHNKKLVSVKCKPHPAISAAALQSISEQ